MGSSLRSAIGKLYVYRFFTGEMLDPLERHMVAPPPPASIPTPILRARRQQQRRQCITSCSASVQPPAVGCHLTRTLLPQRHYEHRTIDHQVLLRAAGAFEGTHNFAAFANQNMKGKAGKNPVRTIHSVRLPPPPPLAPLHSMPLPRSPSAQSQNGDVWGGLQVSTFKHLAPPAPDHSHSRGLFLSTLRPREAPARGHDARHAFGPSLQIAVIDEGEGRYRLDFILDGALYKMVRNIVGTMLQVAAGKMAFSAIDELFGGNPRLPPPGLSFFKLTRQNHGQLTMDFCRGGDAAARTHGGARAWALPRAGFLHRLCRRGEG